MLNPSLADENTLDPTLRRCFDFARRLGHGTMFINNVFPLVSPYPKDLLTAVDRDGDLERNLEHIRTNIARSSMLIVAFGNWPMRKELRYALQPIEALAIASKKTAYALRLNDDGSPRHPLYIAKNTTPIVFRWPQRAL